MAEAEGKNWGLELAHNHFFLSLVAKASHTPELWCWEGPAELHGRWHGYGKGCRIGIINGNLWEKSGVVVMRQSFCRKKYSERLSWLENPIHKSPCGLPAPSRPASTSAAPALRSSPLPGADYSEWMTCRKFFLVPNTVLLPLFDLGSGTQVFGPVVIDTIKESALNQWFWFLTPWLSQHGHISTKWNRTTASAVGH